jgi:OpgC protein
MFFVCAALSRLASAPGDSTIGPEVFNRPDAGDVFFWVNLMSTATASSTTDRDLRLDFFRGLALFCIFIDHLPTITGRGLRFNR